MKRICVVGAGQLGSRHLQALRNVDEPLHVWAVDPSGESLRVARERFEAVPACSRYEISFDQDFARVSGPVDVAIVATSSNARRTAIESLLAKTDVKFLVLEKLLFADRDDYASVGDLLRARGARAWVNCSMRVMPFYRSLAGEFGDGPIHYRVSGSRFGLITNAIHYVDHAASLTKCARFSVRTGHLDPDPIASKRPGFLELNGTLEVDYENGSQCTMTCYPTGDAPILVEIQSEELRCVARESEGKAWVARKSAGWRWDEVEARIPYQSEMTAGVIQELLARGTCALAPYDESAPIHLSLLEPLAAFLTSQRCGSDGRAQTCDFPFT